MQKRSSATVVRGCLRLRRRQWRSRRRLGDLDLECDFLCDLLGDDRSTKVIGRDMFAHCLTLRNCATRGIQLGQITVATKSTFQNKKRRNLKEHEKTKKKPRTHARTQRQTTSPTCSSLKHDWPTVATLRRNQMVIQRACENWIAKSVSFVGGDVFFWLRRSHKRENCVARCKTDAIVEKSLFAKDLEKSVCASSRSKITTPRLSGYAMRRN